MTSIRRTRLVVWVMLVTACSTSTDSPGDHPAPEEFTPICRSVPPVEVTYPTGVSAQTRVLDLSATDVLSLCDSLPEGSADCPPRNVCSTLYAELVADSIACDASTQSLIECTVGLASNCVPGTALALHPPECQGIRHCWKPADDESLATLDRNARDRLCRSLLSECTDMPTEQTDTACGEALDNLVEECHRDASSPSCQWTVSDLDDCRDCALDQCGPLSARASVPADTRSLSALDSRERRALCNDLLAADSTLCEGSIGTEEAREAPETCVAALGTLSAQCESETPNPDCDLTVGQARACVDSGQPGCCPLNGCSETQFHGLLGVSIEESQRGAVRSWCEYRQNLFGGAGYAPASCDHNQRSASFRSAEHCVDDVMDTFSGCGVSLDAVHRCTLGMLDVNACHRVGEFRACRDTGAYEPCHNWVKLAVHCEPLFECLGVGAQ